MKSQTIFNEIKIQCNGMLKPSSYEKIYDAARNARQGQLVEVGTAHGCATVALGLGLKSNNGNSTIHTFDRKEPKGYFEARKDSLSNEEIVRKNFLKYKVEHIITQHVGDINTIHHEIDDNLPISLLMLDADGMIDRDFKFFMHRLLDNAPIIIDDCSDRAKLKFIKRNCAVSVDLKHKLTYELVEIYKSSGLIEEYDRSGETIFCTYKKPTGPIPDLTEEILSAYRKTIFSEGTIHKLSLWGIIKRKVKLAKIRFYQKYR